MTVSLPIGGVALELSIRRRDRTIDHGRLRSTQLDLETSGNARADCWYRRERLEADWNQAKAKAFAAAAMMNLR